MVQDDLMDPNSIGNSRILVLTYKAIHNHFFVLQDYNVTYEIVIQIHEELMQRLLKVIRGLF